METIKLKDCCTFINGDRSENYPSEKDFVSKGIPFVNSGDINNNKINYCNTHQISKEKFNSLKTGKAEKGDILLSIRGSLGKNTMVSADRCAIASMFVIIKAKKNIDSLYLYYCLNENTFKQKLQKLNNGSIQGNISVDILSNIEIPYYDIETQRSIVSILSKIDTQIRRNQDMCHKLQVLAQSTYSRWFNQFEFPNEDGLPYKSNGGKMVWNDELKREIPDGWSTILVGNATKCCLGGTPSRDKIEYWNGNINWINSGEVANFPIIETKEKITESGLQYSATEIMPPKTAIISITGNIRFSINAIPCCANQSVVGVFETEKLPISYLYFVLLENEQKYVKQMTGAIQKHINKDIIEKTTILVPNNQVIQQYNNIVDTIIEQILILSRQTFELNKLKSCILPLLINGQLKL